MEGPVKWRAQAGAAALLCGQRAARRPGHRL